MTMSLPNEGSDTVIHLSIRLSYILISITLDYDNPALLKCLSGLDLKSSRLHTHPLIDSTVCCVSSNLL